MNLTPFDQTLDADLGLIFEDELGPAETVTLIDRDGGEHPLRAMFAAVGLDVTPGAAHAPVVSGAPTLHVALCAVQHAIGRPLSTRDRFLVRGKAFRVQAPMPDGYGLLACKLLETGEDDG